MATQFNKSDLIKKIINSKNTIHSKFLTFELFKNYESEIEYKNYYYSKSLNNLILEKKYNLKKDQQGYLYLSTKFSNYQSFVVFKPEPLDFNTRLLKDISKYELEENVSVAPTGVKETLGVPLHEDNKEWLCK